MDGAAAILIKPSWRNQAIILIVIPAHSAHRRGMGAQGIPFIEPCFQIARPFGDSYQGFSPGDRFLAIALSDRIPKKREIPYQLPPRTCIEDCQSSLVITGGVLTRAACSISATCSASNGLLR